MDYIASYIQKIHSSLQGGGSIKISSFVDDHAQMKPVLHPEVSTQKIDISALLYSILRLPPEILRTESLILGQSDRVFQKARIDTTGRGWKETKAVARQRKYKYHPKTKTLGAFIASISDVEDIMTILTALYIEVAKLHQQVSPVTANTKHKTIHDCFDKADYQKLEEALGENLEDFIELVYTPIDFEIRLLAGSSVDYSKAVQRWWIHIASSRKEYKCNVYEQPIYFVSSNSHSLINVLSGFTKKKQKHLFTDNAVKLKENRSEFERERVTTENIGYYLSRFTEMHDAEYRKEKATHEKKYGLIRMKPFHHIDIEAQVFSIKDFVRNPYMDKRLHLDRRAKKKLLKSDALIVNIAYPLGMGAYNILREVSENAIDMRGVYIMGKAASMNSVVGDITIPDYVRDEHTQNNIFVHNIFDANTFAPYFEKNSILVHQKSVSVRGTFLQSEKSLLHDFKNGYSIIEMEAGPYLNRVYELLYPDRYPMDSTYVLNPDFRLGLAYYVSDTPHKKGLNLGSKRLTWEGLNATYAISLGILNDIVKTEFNRL